MGWLVLAAMGGWEQVRGQLDALFAKQRDEHAEEKQRLDDALKKQREASKELLKQRAASSMCSRLDKHVVRGLEDVRRMLQDGLDALPVIDALVEVMLRKERMLRPPADPVDEPPPKKLRKSTRINHGQPPGAIQPSFETPEKRYQTAPPIAPPPRPLNLNTTAQVTSYLLTADGKRTKKTVYKGLKECAKALKVFNQFTKIKRDMQGGDRVYVTRHEDGAVFELV